MKKEIPFQEGKVVFFKESNFWDDVLQKCNEETKAIYIATYNFNFNQYEKSFYRKLSHLANLGVRVNLLYAIMSYADEDKLEVEEIFKNFVLCAKLTTNHSKFFITDNFAFIGSANFSFNSNNNYECGVIFNNKEIISDIRKFYSELLEESEFTNIPECFDPFEFVPTILSVVEELSVIEKKEELYSDKREAIPELRYLDNIEKHLIELGYPVPLHFDWFHFYMQLYDEKYVTDIAFSDFKHFLQNLYLYLIDVNDFINEQYKTIGRIELLKKIKVIK
ncbi:MULTISPECIES: phospholipase D-like domain-containing protein [Bacillaceae]|uniref:phospholipase D-like domain-containing protein n=1 Tax=Bacillaceae TaxID=186817 RepID=UPI001F50CAC5|nr:MULTISPECIES: phospholipase D-like domain-containing protein [Bacillaceae]MCM3361269.1 phospholipase D-like domain-containing protein [Niallia sp. MER TA 168]